jgi:hypothetical protein
VSVGLCPKKHHAPRGGPLDRSALNTPSQPSRYHADNVHSWQSCEVVP